MPNWCENRLTITGEKANIEAFEAKYIGEDGFTLDKVIPMPEELQHTQKGGESSLGEDLITGNYKRVVGMTWFKDMLKKGGVDAPDDLETLTREDVIALCEQNERCKEWARLGRLSVDMLAKYGHADWYSWSLANWGTKWNIEPSSAERSDGRLYLSFDTAWSPPIPVLDKLMEEFPELYFEMEYLDEGMGFAGVYSNDGCEDREAEEMAAAFDRELETEEDY